MRMFGGVSSGTRRSKEITGWTVFVYLAAFFAIVTGINAVMVAAAISTFSGVEASSAYHAGLNFAREISAAHAQDARHWRVNARAVTDGRGATRLEIVARDASDRPLNGLTATGRLAHPADRRADRTLSLREEAPGVFRAATAVVHGQWDLVIELSRDGARQFRSTNRMTLP